VQEARGGDGRKRSNQEDCDVEDKNLSSIFQTLQKLVGLHRQLMENVRFEREALTNADLKGVQETTFAKEALVEQIRQQESARLKATAELALTWKRPFKELTLTNIIIAIQARDPKGAEQFRGVYNALTILIQRIREANEYNRGLVEKSLEHVHNMKRNVLGEAVPKSETYTPQGQRQPYTGGARLISKEA
jgi:flagellar biosynthesis/type III secretory pathway chaperone